MSRLHEVPERRHTNSDSSREPYEKLTPIQNVATAADRTGAAQSFDDFLGIPRNDSQRDLPSPIPSPSDHALLAFDVKPNAVSILASLDAERTRAVEMEDSSRPESDRSQWVLPSDVDMVLQMVEARRLPGAEPRYALPDGRSLSIMTLDRDAIELCRVNSIWMSLQELEHILDSDVYAVIGSDADGRYVRFMERAEMHSFVARNHRMVTMLEGDLRITKMQLPFQPGRQ